MDTKDHYRSAKLLIDQYGPDATVQAAMKADAMMECGDMAGYAVWKLIIRAIDSLQATDGRTKH